MCVITYIDPTQCYLSSHIDTTHCYHTGSTVTSPPSHGPVTVDISSITLDINTDITLDTNTVITLDINTVIIMMDINTSPCPYQLHYPERQHCYHHDGHHNITVPVSASLSPWSDGYMTFTNHHEHHSGSTVTSPSPRVDGFFYQSQRFSFGSIIDKFWDFKILHCTALQNRIFTARHILDRFD